LPSKPGVYVFLDRSKTIIYVGKAINLKSRVSSYFRKHAVLGEKTKLLVEQTAKIRIILVESELEALLLESFYIKKFQPKYNIRLTDNKAYLLVRITNQTNNLKQYPAVVTARKEDDKNSIYFGPFPSSSSVRLILRSIRHVFPYHSVLNHPKRICLYNHMGLCPCLPVKNSKALREEYYKNIKQIIRIFSGDIKEILTEFEKERDKLSRNELFEKAALLQRKIEALKYVSQPFHKPLEYDFNPNLRIDIRKAELNELQSVLTISKLRIKSLSKIECYDISNISGTNATGSMVVFIDGEKESSMYRRFKIKMENKPDDFAMMAEILQRRIRHIEWKYPDLIIVDGGKGQVSAAVKVLQDNNINIPLIGLAKREEIIVIPRITNFIEVSLPKDSPALHLIMRIRDEAHRFAVTYHRHLRSKAALI
jgi:excinuclease ABC subunit C